jgi:hypothetical protein
MAFCLLCQFWDKKRNASPSGCVLCGPIKLLPTELRLPNHRVHQFVVKLFITNIYGDKCGSPLASRWPKVLGMRSGLPALCETESREYLNHLIGR